MGEELQLLQEALIPVFWNITWEQKSVLEDALYEAIKKSGGFEKFAELAGVPLDALVECNWEDKVPNGKILKKIFPFMFQEMDGAIERFMDKAVKARMYEYYQKYKIDTINDPDEFGQALKNMCDEFESSDNSEQVNSFSDLLSKISELMLS